MLFRKRYMYLFESLRESHTASQPLLRMWESFWAKPKLLKFLLGCDFLKIGQFFFEQKPVHSGRVSVQVPKPTALFLQWRLSSQHHHRQRMNDPWAPFKSKSSWRKLLWMFCHDSCFFNKYYIFRGRGGGQGYTIIVAACNMWKLISHFSCLQKVFQFPGNCWWWVLKCRECVLKHSNKLVKFCCIFEVNFSSYF